MVSRRPELTKPQERLMRLFHQIDDRDIREIMAEVVSIERRYRSAQKFPMRLVKDAIDNVARLQEMTQEPEEG